MRRYVWSRNLKNEEAMARVGPQRHGGGGPVWNSIEERFLNFFCSRKYGVSEW